eukprot:GHVU01224387.1.p1 GENE.GHVU01224387.1~~GHVU01224387.1.p1  ORF type:complete len:211 (-),score=25.63 GHVU01224387.1:72-704(-)
MPLERQRVGAALCRSKVCCEASMQGRRADEREVRGGPGRARASAAAASLFLAVAVATAAALPCPPAAAAEFVPIRAVQPQRPLPVFGGSAILEFPNGPPAGRLPVSSAPPPRFGFAAGGGAPTRRSSSGSPTAFLANRQRVTGDASPPPLVRRRYGSVGGCPRGWLGGSSSSSGRRHQPADGVSRSGHRSRPCVHHHRPNRLRGVPEEEE